MGTGIRVALLTLALTGCPLIQHRPPMIVPSSLATYSPPPMYQLWADQVVRCAKELKDVNPTLSFRIVRDSVNVDRVVWEAVATENSDGGFPCRVGRCVGLASSGTVDTIAISSQYLYRPWVIKHEVLHIAVEKSTEVQAKHGLPWGLCEFF